MPLPADDAVSRRDQTLARTRQASRLITTAAITAAVGLGGAFAHALPGHATAQAATGECQAGGGAQNAGQGQRPSRQRRAASHHHLQPPASSPAPPPASTPSPPPPVTSGG